MNFLPPIVVDQYLEVIYTGKNLRNMFGPTPQQTLLHYRSPNQTPSQIYGLTPFTEKSDGRRLGN